MPVFFTDDDPGATEARVVDYIDGLLGAFSFDPPRIWAGGPFSGRHGGAHGFVRFHRLTPLDELAWRTRIEGSRGRPEREINGPVFAAVTDEERRARLERTPEFTALLYEHACEGMYGAPEYGGNQGLVGWR